MTRYRRTDYTAPWHYHPDCPKWPDGPPPAQADLGEAGAAAPAFEETTVKPSRGEFCRSCRDLWLIDPPPEEQPS